MKYQKKLIFSLTGIAISAIILGGLGLFLEQYEPNNDIVYNAELSEMEWNGAEGLIYISDTNFGEPQFSTLLHPDGTVIAKGNFAVYWSPSETDTLYIERYPDNAVNAIDRYRNRILENNIENIPEDAIRIYGEDESYNDVYMYDQWQCIKTYHDALLSYQFFTLPLPEKQCGIDWGIHVTSGITGKQKIQRGDATLFSQKENLLSLAANAGENTFDIFFLGEESDKILLYFNGKFSVLDTQSQQIALIDIPNPEIEKRSGYKGVKNISILPIY